MNTPSYLTKTRRRISGSREDLPPLHAFLYALFTHKFYRRIFIFIVVVIVIFNILAQLGPSLLLTRFHITNSLYEAGVLPCTLRKEPVLYILSEEEILIWAETNCEIPNGVTLHIAPHHTSSSSLEFDTIKTNYKTLDSHHHIYSAKIHRLPLATTYSYFFEYAAIRSPSYMFTWPGSTKSSKHPSSASTAFRVGFIADNQFNTRTFATLLAHLANRKPNLLLHLGDAVQHANVLQEWETDFFRPLSHEGLSSTVPILRVVGNHDYTNATDVTAPYNPPTNFFALTLGNVRFIALDSWLNPVAQKEFFEAEMTRPRPDSELFRILLVHIPPYIEYWDPKTFFEGGEKDWGNHVRKYYLPRLLKENGGLDLVISGHQHNYQRGKLGTTVYTIIGGGGGSLDREKVQDTKVYDKTFIGHHFGVFEASSSALDWKVYDLQNNLVDELHIVKNKD